MNYIDRASLIMVPSAYKQGTMLSVKPTDGSGDFMYSRFTTGLRRKLDGTYDDGYYNLLTMSEGNVTAYPTRGQVVDAPISIAGFDNSIEFGDNSVTRAAYKTNYTPTIDVTYNLSFFIEMEDGGVPVIGTSTATGDFRLILGGAATVTRVVTHISGNIYRVSGTRKMSGASRNIGLVKYSTQSARKFKISGIQLTEGEDLLPYQRVETKIATPRLNYRDGKTCPAVLFERVSTNLIAYSQDFSSANWGKTYTNVESSEVPNLSGGFFNKITATGSNAYISTFYTGTIGTSYVASFTIKNIDATASQLSVRDSLTAFSLRILWDGDLVSSYSFVAGTGTVVYDRLIDGSYRFSITYISNEARQRVRIFPDTATGTQSILSTNIQLEEGTFPTSYIPTIASIQTRSSDTAYVDLLGKDLLNPSNFTMYFEGFLNYASTGQMMFGLNDSNVGVSPASVCFYNRMNGFARGITETLYIVPNNLPNNSRFKGVIVRNGTTVSFYVNGVKIGLDKELEVRDYRYLLLHNGGAVYELDALMMFKESLSETEIIELTTL